MTVGLIAPSTNLSNFNLTSFYAIKHVMDSVPEKQPLHDESTADFDNIYDAEKNVVKIGRDLPAFQRFLLKHKTFIIRHIRLWQTRLHLPHLFDEDMCDECFYPIILSIISGSILVTMSALLLLVVFLFPHQVPEDRFLTAVVISCIPAFFSLECWFYLAFGPSQSQPRTRAETAEWSLDFTWLDERAFHRTLG